MQTFSSVEEVFEWWLKNIYPAIPAETKKGRYRNAWRDYTFKKGISQKRMKEILSEFGDVQEETVIAFQLKLILLETCTNPYICLNEDIRFHGGGFSVVADKHLPITSSRSKERKIDIRLERLHI